MCETQYHNMATTIGIQENTTIDIYGNTTTGEEENADSVWAAFSYYGVLFVGVPLIMLNALGNGMTIIAILKDPVLRVYNQNLYIFNLALADFGIALVSMPLEIDSTLKDWVWDLGRGVCKFYLGWDYVMCAEASLTLVLISYDRMLMIRDRVNYDHVQVRCLAIRNIAVSWCMAILFYTPGFITFDYLQEYDEGTCKNEFDYVPWYIVLVVMLKMFIPFIMLTTFCSLMAFSVHKHEGELVMWSASYFSDQDVVNAEKQLTVCLVAMITTFAIFSMPYSLVQIINSLCVDCVSEGTKLGLLGLLWINTAIYPFHYYLYSDRLRAHYQRMLCPMLFERVQPLVPEMNSDSLCDSVIIHSSEASITQACMEGRPIRLSLPTPSSAPFKHIVPERTSTESMSIRPIPRASSRYLRSFHRRNLRSAGSSPSDCHRQRSFLMDMLNTADTDSRPNKVAAP